MSRICVWRGSKELLQQVALCVKLRVGVCGGVIPCSILSNRKRILLLTSLDTLSNCTELVFL